MEKRFAQVHILDVPYPADRPYTYLVPEELSDEVGVGSFVMVPMGQSDVPRIALITALEDRTDVKKVKSLLRVCAPSLSLGDEFVGLCAFLKKQTLCTIGEAARSMVPAASLGRALELFALPESKEGVPDGNENLSDKEKALLSLFADGRGRTSKWLKENCTKEEMAGLRDLASRGFLSRRPYLEEHNGAKYETRYRLTEDRDGIVALLHGEGKARIRSSAHRTVLEALLTYPEDASFTSGELLQMCEISGNVLSAMVKHNWIRTFRVRVNRDPYAAYPVGEPIKITLNEEQEKAYKTLSELIDAPAPGAALLYGITGSGKTSVMLRAVEKVLSKGQCAIILLPEIALTPQSVSVFKNRFGDLVTVLHSGLSAGERLDAYAKIREGLIKIVVGTRSAVFAPVTDLGLIVIDEEQESTYKSDQNPKYHARDVARYRCAKSGAVMLLCSATPSLESYKKALDGTYRLLTLTKRYGKAKLPDVTVTDTGREIERGNDSPLSEPLLEALSETFRKNEQAILFLNRRGYHKYLKCADCGATVNCPNCSVSMTYHTSPKNFNAGYLCCHWCGTRMPVPASCPACGNTHLLRFGYGTQRIEERLPKLIPGIRVLRMDMDSTGTKEAYDDLLTRFRNHEADVLLGTQMVTKGHDFPLVTLVGVLSADASLHLDDYRAAERTFSMLTQVVGRAGRADRPGLAVIQTENSSNRVIRLSCAQDYPSFYASEIGLRQSLQFPPFCDLVMLTLTGTDETQLRADAKLTGSVLEADLKAHPEVPMIVYGPVEAPVFKVENSFRLRFVIKCKWNADSRAIIEPLYAGTKAEYKIKSTLSLDINPSSV